MRRIALFAILFASPSIAQDNQHVVESEIDHVTVFLQGAQVKRSATVNLKKGDNEIRFTGLSRFITKNTIQVKGKAGVTITSVNQEINYLTENQEPTNIKLMRAELDALKRKKRVLDNDWEVWKAEKEMILSNQDISGDEVGVDAVELLDLADYYRERLNKIDLKLLDVERDRKEVRREIDNTNKQLREYGYTKNKSVGEIIVKVSAKGPTSVNMSFDYMVSQAGWIPFYDVRSADVDGPIELTYKGNVYQKTGIPWDNVTLTLSTGNPSISGTKPEFYAWNLQNYHRSSEGKSRPKGFTGEAYNAPARDQIELSGGYGAGETVASYTTATEAGVNNEFKIKLPYSIPTDGQELAVEIQKYSLPCEYEYYTAPKFDPDAFLISRVSGWDEYYLLSGEAQIYYQGIFVGSTYINTQTAEDTLTISLGRDNNMVVKRKKLKEFSKTSSVGSSRKTEVGMEIAVKNTKGTTVTVEIEDQIPISGYKEIEVNAIDLGGATHDEETGSLKWRMVLGPGENKTVQFKYSVKRPKDVYIPNL